MLNIVLIFIIGLALGSFYLLIGTRLPKKENVVSKSSNCDHCHAILKWYNLIPVLSYIFQLGKCSECKKKISILYPLVEIITGLLFAIVYIEFGFSYMFYMAIILVSLFILICITDFKDYIILDSPLLISVILIIVVQLIYFDLDFLIGNLLSGAGLFVMLLAIKKIGDFLFKKESLGGGDIKFAFIIGLAVGFELSLFVLILSVFLALPTSVAALIVSKNNLLPYGPFLAGALLIVFMYADKFTNLLNYISA